MSKSFKVDLTGQRFGRLTVLEFVPTEDKRTHWLCKCDCGNEKIVWHGNLISGEVASCGCLKKDLAAKTHTTHGYRFTRLYKIYTGMKTRCYNKNTPAYKKYGGRGIQICEEWLNDFTAFRDWALSHGYTDSLSIDRIDVNGNYEPTNCRWSTDKTQANNRRNTHYVKLNGKSVSLSEAAKILGIDLQVLQLRYHRGDRGDRLFRPVRKTK